MDRADLEIRGNVVNILTRYEGLEARINGPKSAAFIIWGALTDTLMSYERENGNEGDCLKALTSLIFMDSASRKGLLANMVKDYERLNPHELDAPVEREW